MKVSEHWLREWINPSLNQDELCAQLAMAGLEIEDVSKAAPELKGVIVAQVLTVEKHPEADRLHICQVDVGAQQPLTIICGAKNVKPGIKVPAALEGTTLPTLAITVSKIRGVTSHGMLCSAIELGLSEQGEGLMVLPEEAPVGQSLEDYLNLNDYVLELGITPNRGDCLSVKGLAREIGALTETTFHAPDVQPVTAKISDVLPIVVHVAAKCPRYTGRVIRDIKADAVSPIWMQERLRRGGIRSINAIVDVMNYVMLELGQPMHAFDLNTMTSEIQIRNAHAGESIRLLDGQVIELAENSFVIADAKAPLALAGVMGGLDSAVTLQTTDVFLESAYFSPEAIAETARRYQLNSDSAYRFERGVDPELAALALERATALLLKIAGGKPGPLIEKKCEETLPTATHITLRKNRLHDIVGFVIEDRDVENSLKRLGFSAQSAKETWEVVVPTCRADVVTEIDLIEEVIRIYGYDHIPIRFPTSTMQLKPRPESRLSSTLLRRRLCEAGLTEVITYSFVEKKLQQLLDPGVMAKALVNPMTAEMDVMRTNLWPGLINTFLYNQNRQQSRIRLFETGLRFILNGDDLEQQSVISGLISGDAYPEQWGVASRPLDFYDVKGILENLISLTLDVGQFSFAQGEHLALHPGQTTMIYRQDQPIGVMGALHPEVLQALDIKQKVYAFEIILDKLQAINLPYSQEISKFPSIRRDLAIVVEASVPSSEIQDTIKKVAGDLLQDLHLFDVYQGKGIADHQKSLALALTLQHHARTLRDEDVADVMNRVVAALKQQFAAELRG